MLRKLIVGIIVVNFVFMLVTLIAPLSEWTKYTAIADNTTVIYTAGATVPQFLNLNAFLYKMLANGSDIDFSAGTQPSLAYGTLADNGFGALIGQTAYASVFYPVTSGRRYEIRYTGTVLSGPGGAQIGAGVDNTTGSTVDAYLVYPDYQWLDTIGNVTQGAPPTGASVRPIAKVASTNQPVYTSDVAGLTRALRAYIGINGVPEGGTLLNYAQGHNGGTGVNPNPPYNHGSNWDVVTQNQPSGSYSGSVTFTLNLI